MNSETTRSESKLNEIIGVVLLGLAALSVAAVYFDAGGIFGGMSRNFVFGMTGSFGYFIPIIFAAAGVYMIAARRSPMHTGKRVLAVLGLLFILSMAHLGVAELISVPSGTYGMFLSDSYAIGMTSHNGGGVIGGLLTYWTYSYLGLAGSWIVLIVGLAVCVLAVTNLSIRKLSEDLGTVVKSTYEEHRTRTTEARERRRLYVESVHDAGRAGSSNNPFDMRVQPLDVKRKAGGRRKTPVPQPELDPPFSVTPKRESNKPPVAFMDNVVDLSSRRAAQQAAKKTASEPIDDTAQKIAVNQSIAPVIEPRRETEPNLPPRPAQPYDPDKYRKVFADTDIQFDDNPLPEVREKRKIDPALVERVTGKYAKVDAAPPNVEPRQPDTPPWEPMYHIETGQNRDGTAAVVAADVGGKTAVETPAGYRLPPLELLSAPSGQSKTPSSELQQTAALLEETLRTFNVEAHVDNILEGPVVTRFELKLAPGTAIRRVVNLADNIAMALAARTLRIEAPVPGKSVVGIEVPKKNRDKVGLREMLQDPKFSAMTGPLTFALGKDITGTPVYADIAKMPHLLIAGQTGAGKSVCVNALIVSILYRCSPDEVQMLMIDPKQVELSVYNPIPHLISGVVTDPKKASLALNWAVNEMNQRYKLLEKHTVRDLKSYNQQMEKMGEKKLPHILLMVDEFAELMMVAKKEVEEAIIRIAQLGRAAGIHLVLATQRPVADVITGLIKSNVPGRIGLSVRSAADSNIILGTKGAEKLLGDGDMLFYTTGLAAPERIQGCYVGDSEIQAVVDYIKDQKTDSWRTRLEFDEEEELDNSSQTLGDSEEDGRDKLYYEAMRLAVENDGVSTSFLQRRLRIGYGRAARLLDELQMDGIISAMNGSKAREILISREEFEQLYGEYGGSK